MLLTVDQEPHRLAFPWKKSCFWPKDSWTFLYSCMSGLESLARMDQWRKISPIRHYELRPLSAWISPQRTLPVQRVISIFQSHCSPAVALSGHPPSQLALRSLPCRSRRAALCLKRMLSPHIAPQRMLLGTSHLPSLPFYKCQHPLFQASFQTDEFSDISCAIAWVQLVQGGCKIIAICKIPQWRAVGKAEAE